MNKENQTRKIMSHKKNLINSIGRQLPLQSFYFLTTKNNVQLKIWDDSTFKHKAEMKTELMLFV